MLNKLRSETVSNTKSLLRISSLVPESIVDGPGIRYVVFVQGCPHHCQGCHNPETHDFTGGRDVRVEDILQEIQDNPLLSGVTFSGGEPFCQAEGLASLATGVHSLGLDIMVYTGYTLEQLSRKTLKEPGVAALLKQTDTLVDGPFVLAQRDLTLAFRGSRNQRLIAKVEILQSQNKEMTKQL